MRDTGELPRQPPLELPAVERQRRRRFARAAAALAAAAAIASGGAPAARAQATPGGTATAGGGAAPAGPATSAAGSTATTIDPNVLTAPALSDQPPPGWRLSARRVVRAAERLPKIATVRREHRGSYSRAFLRGDRRWQVSTFAPRPGADEEIGQTFVDDRSGAVLESWTGIQVAWTMARGYPGAFGRRANAPWVWLPLLVLFVLPFLRPPFRLVHLDLLVLASFSLSYFFFCRGEIGLSVPLAYPPMVYLLVRMLLLARARARDRPPPPRPPLRLLVGAGFLSIAIVFLLGFRIGLNVTSSNVIDVGYSGVIGADRIADGDPLYGRFPKDNPHGDTYGPAVYYAYMPFEQALPWGGRWDALPAAHGAAIAFDLLCVLLLWQLGRRLAGARLGLLLAYLWLTFPFTLVVSNSNANDALVAALVLAALLVVARPLARGAAVAAAGLAKFAPLGLFPLMATFPAGRAGRREFRTMALTGAGFAAAAIAILTPVALIDGGLGNLWERALRFQAERESPFSIWGYWQLGTPQWIVQIGAAALAVAVALVPRRRDVVSLCALAAAVLIATQLGVSHWFYLYIVWFLPPLLAAGLAEYADPDPDPEPARG